MTIPENTPEDALVELVNATDRDDGVNGAVTFEIIGGNVNNAFKIKTPSVSYSCVCVYVCVFVCVCLCVSVYVCVCLCVSM